MSTKLLYSLSDDNSNLQKQIGCMNGFLHLFDRHHFVNRRLPPGENRHQRRDTNTASKRSKEKHQKVAKEQQKNDVESSRASFSSAAGSATLSSVENDPTTKAEQSTFGETSLTEITSRYRTVNQSQASPYRLNSSPKMSHQVHKNHIIRDSTRTSASPVRTVKREQVVKHTTMHMDSPRLLQSSKLDSPRLAPLNESFRSISSNQSAPVTPRRKKDPTELLAVKDAPRLSYDGTELRKTFISSVKLGDFPRLSLDSRQRNINKSIDESEKELRLKDLRRERYNTSKIQNLPEEPGSYRPPSNIVAKLMGLEVLTDCTPTNRSQIDTDSSSIGGRLDTLSRSSRTIDQSKVNRALDSPSNNCKDSESQRFNKIDLVAKHKLPARISIETTVQKQQDSHPDSARELIKHEANPEPQNHSLSLYGEIEKRFADLDFGKSGKDLRALKQILEAMHRENTKQETKREPQTTPSTFQKSTSNSSYISHTQGPQKANQKQLEATCRIPQTSKGSRELENIIATRATKPAKLVRVSRKEAAPVTQEVVLPRLRHLRVGQHVDTIQGSIQKRTKDPTPEVHRLQDPARQTHCIIARESVAGSPRQLKSSKAPQEMTKVDFTCSPKMLETVRTKMYNKNSVLENHRHTHATTLGSRTKHKNQQTMGPRSQTQKLQQKSSILQKNDQSRESTTNTACLSQQGNSSSSIPKINSSLVSQTHIVISSTDHSGMKYDTQWNNKNPRVPSDESFPELTIAIREQPSPVSVLDATFYGDESPSPVKKKPTAFRDEETTSIPTDAEWRSIDLNDSTHSISPSFSNNRDHQKLEKLKQSAQTLWQLNHNDGESVKFPSPLHELNPQKAYVAEILLASGFPDNLYVTEAIDHVHQSMEAINPNLFFVLEQTKASRFFPDNNFSSKAKILTRTCERHRRRLTFDAVNEALSEKLSSTGHGFQPQLFLNEISRFRTGEELLQEIFKQIDQLQANNIHRNLDDEDEFLTTIIGKDLTHTSANWTKASCETPGLVLDIERLIFKDLIAELVHDMSAHAKA